jgi:hypothetical protein
MKSENVIADYLFQFPHVTELTLTGDYTINIHSFIDNLSRIMLLTYITNLHISDNDQCLNTCAKLLVHMPNVHILVVNTMSSFGTHFLSEKQVNTVDLIYDNNVTNVIIDYGFTLDTAQMLINLFPRMQCLYIWRTEENLVSIVRIMLLKRINNNHFFSLIVDGRYVTIEQLKTMIDCEKLLDDYKMEHLGNSLCLWW